MKGLAILSLILGCGAATASPVDLVFEHCVLPQVQGIEIDGVGLIEITAEEAGSTQRDLPLYQSREFFQIPETDLILAIGYNVGLRACRVTGFDTLGFNQLVGSVSERLESYGIVLDRDCSDWMSEGERAVHFSSASRFERDRYVTIGVLQMQGKSGPEILVWETPTSNVDRRCGDET